MDKVISAIQKVWDETKVPLYDHFEGMFVAYCVIDTSLCDKIIAILESHEINIINWESDSGHFRFFFKDVKPIKLMVSK